MFQRHRCADRRYMQRNLVSSIISAFALGLLAAGCASHPAATVVSSTPAPLLPFHSGALMGVVTAAAIDRHARPLKVSTVFAQTAKQIVAVAFVGKVPKGSQLTIAWEAYNPVGGVREMFEQRVRVSSFQRAYSTAVAHGRLTLGSYRVHVTLGDREIETPFNISEQVRGSRATGLPDDPAPGASGAADTDLCIPECNDHSSHYAGPCTSVKSVYGEDIGLLVDAHIFADPSECRGGVTLAATVQGPFKVVLTDVGGYIDNTIIPCDLPGGNDEPGTIVQLEGYTAGHESEAKHGEATLVDTNPFPLIEGSSQPQTGTKVKPGDTIHFRVMALEVPPSAGVQSLTATTNIDSRVVQDKINNPPKPCTVSEWARLVDFVLTVPKKPPPVIQVRFVARDFRTRQDTLTAYYPTTGHLWKGTISATNTYRTHPPFPEHGSYVGTYDGTLELVEDPQGAIKGHGRVVADGCEFPNIPMASFAVFEVTGTDNGKQLELQIVPGSMRSDGPLCGFGYGWAVVPGTSPGSAVFPITPPGTAQGPWHARADLPAILPTTIVTLDYHVDLTCTDCQESH